jgi:AbrB family looped-hinge helix DNA binding protein
MTKKAEKLPKTKVGHKFQVTIPSEVRRVYPLEEGQYVVFEVRGDGVLMRVVPEIDPSQAWFWSPRWQELEREASDDFRSGRVTEAESADEAIRALKKRSR